MQKGPLRWLVTLTAGERRPSRELADAIRPCLRASAALERVGLRIAAAIAEATDPPTSLAAQLTILGYAMSAANAARLLIRSGHVRAAESQMRAIIEDFAVIEYLDGHIDRADAWRRAVTRKEREAFGFGRIRASAPTAARFQPLWDGSGEYIHTNSSALPTHSHRRDVFGYDIPVGPFFDPLPIVTMLAITDSVIYLLLEWSVEHLVPLSRRAVLSRQLDRAGARVTTREAEARQLARNMRPATPDGIPVSDQRGAVAFIARQARRVGQNSAAAWLVARSKEPR